MELVSFQDITSYFTFKPERLSSPPVFYVPPYWIQGDQQLYYSRPKYSNWAVKLEESSKYDIMTLKFSES